MNNHFQRPSDKPEIGGLFGDTCFQCGGKGYTGCESIFGLAILRDGVACSCPAGAKFVELQMELRSEFEDEEHSTGRDGHVIGIEDKGRLVRRRCTCGWVGAWCTEVVLAAKY